MTYHQVIICDTTSKRQAVLYGSESKGDWVAECDKVADDWLKRNGKQEAASRHAGNGNLYIWIY